MGLFDQFKQGLQKTTRLLKTDVRDLFKSEGRLVDESLLEELLEALVLTDMPARSTCASPSRTGSGRGPSLPQIRGGACWGSAPLSVVAAS